MGCRAEAPCRPGVSRRGDREEPQNETDGNVDAVRFEIGRLHRCGDPDVDLRIELHETIEAGHEPFDGEAGCRADDQNVVLPEAIQALDGLSHGFEGRMNAGIDQAGRFGQFDGPRATVKQLQAEPVFESANLMAQRCRRDMQLPGGLGEAEVPRRGLESSQRVQRGNGRGISCLRISHSSRR